MLRHRAWRAENCARRQGQDHAGEAAVEFLRRYRAAAVGRIDDDGAAILAPVSPAPRSGRNSSEGWPGSETWSRCAGSVVKARTWSPKLRPLWAMLSALAPLRPRSICSATSVNETARPWKRSTIVRHAAPHCVVVICNTTGTRRRRQVVSGASSRPAISATASRSIAGTVSRSAALSLAALAVLVEGCLAEDGALAVDHGCSPCVQVGRKELHRQPERRSVQRAG